MKILAHGHIHHDSKAAQDRNVVVFETYTIGEKAILRRARNVYSLCIWTSNFSSLWAVSKDDFELFSAEDLHTPAWFIVSLNLDISGMQKINANIPADMELIAEYLV